MKSFFQRIHESHSGTRKPTSNDPNATYQVWVPPTKLTGDHIRQLPPPRHTDPTTSTRRTGEKRSSSRAPQPPDPLYESHVGLSSYNYATVPATGRTSHSTGRTRAVNAVASVVPPRSHPHTSVGLQSSSHYLDDQAGWSTNKRAPATTHTPAPEVWIPPPQQPSTLQQENKIHHPRRTEEKQSKSRDRVGSTEQGGRERDGAVLRDEAKEEKTTWETENRRHGEGTRQRERMREGEQEREAEREAEAGRGREKGREREREREERDRRDRDRDRDRAKEPRREPRKDRDRPREREREPERGGESGKDSVERNRVREVQYGERMTGWQRDQERGGRDQETDKERIEDRDGPPEMYRARPQDSRREKERDAVPDRPQRRDRERRREKERDKDERKEQERERDKAAELEKYRKHRAHFERDRDRHKDMYNFLDRRHEPGREGIPWDPAALPQLPSRQRQAEHNLGDEDTSGSSPQKHLGTLPTHRRHHTDGGVPVANRRPPHEAILSVPLDPTLLHFRQPTFASSSSENQAGTANVTPSALPVHLSGKESTSKVSQDRQHSQVDLTASGLSGGDAEGTKRWEHRHRVNNPTLDAKVEQPSRAPATDASSAQALKSAYDRTENASDSKPEEPTTGLSSRWPFFKTKASSHNPPVTGLDPGASEAPAEPKPDKHIEHTPATAKVVYTSASHQAATRQAQMSQPSQANAFLSTSHGATKHSRDHSRDSPPTIKPPLQTTSSGSNLPIKPSVSTLHTITKHSRGHSRDSPPMSKPPPQTASSGFHLTSAVKYHDSRSQFQSVPPQSVLVADASVEFPMVDTRESRSYGMTTSHAEVPSTANHPPSTSALASHQPPSQPQQPKMQVPPIQPTGSFSHPYIPSRKFTESEAYPAFKDSAPETHYVPRSESFPVQTPSPHHQLRDPSDSITPVSYLKESSGNHAHIDTIVAGPNTRAYPTSKTSAIEAPMNARSHSSHAPAMSNQTSRQAESNPVDNTVTYDKPHRSYGTSSSVLEATSTTQSRQPTALDQTSLSGAQLNQNTSHLHAETRNYTLEAAMYAQSQSACALQSSNYTSQQGQLRTIAPSTSHLDEKSAQHHSASNAALEAATITQPHAVDQASRRLDQSASQLLVATKSSAPESTTHAQSQPHVPALSDQVYQHGHTTRTEATATQPGTLDPTSNPTTRLNQKTSQRVAMKGSVPESTAHVQPQSSRTAALSNQILQQRHPRTTDTSTIHSDEKPSHYSNTSKGVEPAATTQSRASAILDQAYTSTRLGQSAPSMYGTMTPEVRAHPSHTPGVPNHATSKGALAMTAITQSHAPTVLDQPYPAIHFKQSASDLQGTSKDAMPAKFNAQSQPSHAPSLSGQVSQQTYPTHVNERPSRSYGTSKNEPTPSRAPSIYQTSFHHKAMEPSTTIGIAESTSNAQHSSIDTTSRLATLSNKGLQQPYPEIVNPPATHVGQNPSHLYASNATAVSSEATRVGDSFPSHDEQMRAYTSDVSILPLSSNAASHQPNPRSSDVPRAVVAPNDIGAATLKDSEPSRLVGAVSLPHGPTHSTLGIRDAKSQPDQRDRSPPKASVPNLIAEYEARATAPKSLSKRDAGTHIQRPSTAMGCRQNHQERVPLPVPAAGLSTGSAAPILKFPRLASLDSNANWGSSLQRPATAMSSRHHRVDKSYSLEPLSLPSIQIKVSDPLQSRSGGSGAALYAQGGPASNYDRQATLHQVMSAAAPSTLQNQQTDTNYLKRQTQISSIPAAVGAEHPSTRGPETHSVAGPVTPITSSLSRDNRAEFVPPAIPAHRSIDRAGLADPRNPAPESFKTFGDEQSSVLQQPQSLGTSRAVPSNEGPPADTERQGKSKVGYSSRGNAPIPQRNGHFETPAILPHRDTAVQTADVSDREQSQRQTTESDPTTTGSQVYRPPIHHAKLAELLSSPAPLYHPEIAARDTPPAALTSQHTQSNFARSNAQSTGHHISKARHSPPKAPYEVDNRSNVISSGAYAAEQLRPQHPHSNRYAPSPKESSRFTTLPTQADVHNRDPPTPPRTTPINPTTVYLEKRNTPSAVPQAQPLNHRVTEAETPHLQAPAPSQGVSSSRNHEHSKVSQKYSASALRSSSTYPTQPGNSRSQPIAAEMIHRTQRTDPSRTRGTASNNNTTTSQTDLPSARPVVPPPPVSSQMSSIRPQHNVSIPSNSVSLPVDPVSTFRTHPNTSTRTHAPTHTLESRSDIPPQSVSSSVHPPPVAESHRVPEKLSRKPSEDTIILKTPSSLVPSMLKPTISSTSIPASLSSQQESRKRGLFGMFRSKTAQPPAQAEEALNPPTERTKRKESKTNVELLKEKAPPPQDTKVVPSLASRVKPPPPITVPIPINPSSGRKSPNSKVFTPFRYLASKRHRTMSAASIEAQDGTAPNTVVGSPTASMHSTQPPPIQPPPLRDPLIATQEWRKQEAAEARQVSGGRLRRARPGVVFDVAEDPYEDQKRRPTRSKTPSRSS